MLEKEFIEKYGDYKYMSSYDVNLTRVGLKGETNERLFLSYKDSNKVTYYEELQNGLEHVKFERIL